MVSIHQETEFTVRHHDDDPGPVIAGFAQFGLAGLTAVDYLATQLEFEPVGHIRAAGLPSITPFEEGRPRHPTRLLSHPDVDCTILMGELFVPGWAAMEFGAELVDWIEGSVVEELCLLSGVPIPHGPDDHRTFWIATDDYQPRLEATSIQPMRAGFLDGVNATLVEQGMVSELAVSVLVTPVHMQVPDVEAALRLVESVNEVYDFGVDPGPLEEFAEQVSSYYEGLAERLDEVTDRELPEDRMYM